MYFLMFMLHYYYYYLVASHKTQVDLSKRGIVGVIQWKAADPDGKVDSR